jgi:hypothetical protein
MNAETQADLARDIDGPVRASNGDCGLRLSFPDCEIDSNDPV